MANNDEIAVKDAVHKLQLSLLEGIRDESQLFAAGSVMSQGDYKDVVTERSIANLCGYPLCKNSLPNDRTRKGRYRISLKEHKVYDLNETYMYCSTSCVVNSRSFGGSLPEERCFVLNPRKLREVVEMFEGLSLAEKDDQARNSGLGSAELRIHEKMDANLGEVSLEEWIGPSNAIEGYVPQRERGKESSRRVKFVEGSEPRTEQDSKKKGGFFNEMEFTSCIITEDEYCISKSLDSTKPDSGIKVKEQKGKASPRRKKDKITKSGKQAINSKIESDKPDRDKNRIVEDDNNQVLEVSSGSCDRLNSTDAEQDLDVQRASNLKPSLKPSGSKKVNRSVSWADEKNDGTGSGNLCEFEEVNRTAAGRSDTTNIEDDDKSYRYASAEACAAALSQAAEAVSSGSDIVDAVSDAGIVIMPPPQEVDKARLQDNVDVHDVEPAPLKWPQKPGISNIDVFDSGDSWYDSPPEEFNLSLSPFATMFMTLFAWISSSSLAYIYGRDESCHEEYLFVNGREYPQKIVLTEGRSAEIKHTLSGCLERALPGLVAELRIPTPLSTLEQGMSRLLDTMSFVDPLPPFRMKQWQVIVLLFLDALSVCRIPALTRYMADRRILVPKVLDGAQISAEEYEIMKDLMIPLGRVPEISMQSGG